MIILLKNEYPVAKPIWKLCKALKMRFYAYWWRHHPEKWWKYVFRHMRWFWLVKRSLLYGKEPKTANFRFGHYDVINSPWWPPPLTKSNWWPIKIESWHIRELKNICHLKSQGGGAGPQVALRLYAYTTSIKQGR